ncbi:MAG: dipeptidase [Chloroflexi bacterium HGW-Chloroflexi-3]|nr:MAG: dipeptidase [Chloroflexi bacterium HGW-Chloroflexi-3]
MSLRSDALEYSKNNYDFYQGILQDFIEIPSISTDPLHKSNMLEATNFIKEILNQFNIHDVQIFETKGHPVVFAEKKSTYKDPLTVLIYGHYDVQPSDPMELWETDPFTPTIRNDRLFGRGASDMKGQIVASLAAYHAINSTGQIPVNFKFIIEGEEEIGSPNLAGFLANNKDLLKCDVILNPDSGMISAQNPTIVYGLRGLTYFELNVYGPDHDLHSGMFGGVIHNPAIVLSELITKMHDDNWKVTLPGFYEDVIPFSDEEREQLSRLPISDEDLLRQTGSPALWGEKGYNSIERLGTRPTLEINGMLSGFTGEGSKTIIPSSAMAKISMRTVPNQDPEKIYHQLKKFIELNIPQTVKWDLKQFAGGWASISDISHPGVIALTKALETEWGIKPLFKREGGSIPVVAAMQRILGKDSVLTGFGLPEDKIHSPNESLHIPTWKKGILSLIHFFCNYAGIE